MQALNVQFLSQPNVGKTSGGIDDSLKKNDSTSSFKSMLETASKKSESSSKDYSIKDNRSVKDETSISERKQNLDRAEQAEKIPAAAKDQENSHLTPKKERIAVSEDDADESSSVIESGLEAVMVFGQEVVQVSDDAVATEVDSGIPAATGIAENASGRQFQEIASFVENTQEQVLNQMDVSAKESAIALEAAVAYAGAVMSNDDAVDAEGYVEQKQDAVPLLHADSEFVSEESLFQENISENVKMPQKTSAAENASLFTDKAGNTVISVVDERGKASKIASLSLDNAPKNDVVDKDSLKKTQSLTAESVRQNGNVLDISMVPVDVSEQNILSSSSQAASAVDSTFQQMLSNQIQQSAPEFVKAGNIILKDNDNGTINMNLKPESLGNVKISLHLSDKGIEGQIVVATKEAFEAFKQNMDTLRHSFQQNGFENTELNLSFSNNSHSNDSFGQERQQSTEQFFANKTFSNYADVPESASASGSVNIYGNSSHIDVVA